MKILSFSHANLKLKSERNSGKRKASLLPVTKTLKRIGKYSMLDYYYYQIISQQISPSQNIAFAFFVLLFMLISYITLLIFYYMTWHT